MTATKQHVTIKGVRDGLVFLLDDACDFSVLLAELAHKLEGSHQQILSGPIIHVQVRLGRRIVDEEEKEAIQSLIRKRGNLVVQSIVSDPADADPAGELAVLKVMSGIVRSGQTFRHEGDLLFMGDVNPGGTIVCTGSIYLLGSLRGMAHAGVDGETSSIIAASYMSPTQLRIADVISRPPDEWGIDEAHMEFAYLAEDGTMAIDKIQHLHRVRPTAQQFTRQMNGMG